MLLHSLRALFRSVNSKILLIVSGATLASVGLFLLGALSIEALVLFWNLAFVASLIVWERHKRARAQTGGITFSNDEKWSRIKRDIERVEGRLGKTRDSEKRRSLLHEKHLLENELRRVEWSIKESNLNGVYNAGTRNLRKLDPKGIPTRNEAHNETSDEDSEEIDLWDRYTPEGALRQRKRLERQAEERKTLQRIIDNAEAILKTEPADSIPTALKSVANDFKAHYNVLKKRKNNQDTLADYWVAWAVISSVMNGVKVDPDIAKYATAGFRPRIVKFIRLVDSISPKSVVLSQASSLEAPIREPGAEPGKITLEETPADRDQGDESEGKKSAQ
ncbi:MAG: hypothetical protein ACRECH_02760 [Nitrososphaerales archaeon]